MQFLFLHVLWYAPILFIFRIAKGDNVNCIAQNIYMATAHAVEITGAKPIFVDCRLKKLET